MKVLITGGSEGIGRGLAARFLKTGHRVLVTGRDAAKLTQAAGELPGLEIFVNDIGKADDREALARFVQDNMPGIDVLINNAGIQRRVALAADTASWAKRQAEIDILLAGPVHLNHLLIPTLILPGKQSLIVNVTSGGAYIPQVFAPMYSACKAALHHYTITLRDSLKETSCKVTELIPPAVQTGLAGPGQQHGVALEDFCDEAFAGLIAREQEEIGFGPTADLKVEISGKPLKSLFDTSAARFPILRYTS